MFAKQFETYRIGDAMKIAAHMGDGSDQVTIRKKQSDAIMFANLSPALRSRVFQAALEASNGKRTRESKLFELQIETLLESGKLEPSVAAALLRVVNTEPMPEAGFETLNPSLTTRSDGASGQPDYYYDSHRPAPRNAVGGFEPGKTAGDRRFMDLLKNYLHSHRIGSTNNNPSLARGARWR
jgi:hypothetical protein